MTVPSMGVASMGPPVERARVLLWPQTPALAEELPSSDARFELVPPAALLEDIERARAEASSAEHARLAEIDAGLATARDRFAALQWTEMERELVALEQSRLVELADPRHCDSLWELEFRLALAYRGLRADAKAEERLAFALAIAPQRRPARELFTPEVVADFLAAVDANAGKVARPIRLSMTPSDAAVSIDCVPVPEDGRVELRAGLHVVHAHAPGHAVHAAIFELPADGRLAITAPKHDEPDPVRRLGLTTADGVLHMTASGRRALADAAAARDVDAVVVVIREQDGVAARVLAGTATGPIDRADALAPALARAFDRLDDRGHLRPPPPKLVPGKPQGDPDPPAKKPLVKRAWFWLTIVAGVGLAVGLGVGLGLRTQKPDRFEIGVR
ncbi:MAG TPA: hypothetical protein VG755_20600 [Nannocystaceae bacterium]|nr:hypothetical protein [Nannocystaceae bacterium]